MLRSKKSQASFPYEKLVAERSATAPGRATRGYYGVNVHQLLDEAVKDAKNQEQKKSDARIPSVENPRLSKNSMKGRTMLWTEKYRAKKFTDLVGDERTHRDVLRWLKGWDPVVFPATSRLKPRTKLVDTEAERQQQPKILLLAGPPGLGKTTLAHVCARQAGYEVVEINASDERSRDVVKGRIKDCVGTENVKSISTKNAAGFTRKAGRPVCVVVDEVDGVVSGSGGGGEGGFIKALIDLIILDQKNSKVLKATSVNIVESKKKGGRFRLLRPIILICNDIYHSALRPLRACAMAEIIHIRRPPLDKVVARLKSVFDTEGVACDREGVRRLCEATWGIADKRESQTKFNDTGEGDMRGILVVGEWVAAKLRAATSKPVRLTKKWVEENMLENLSHDGGGARSPGHGGAKHVVERVFLYDAGFSKAAFTATGNPCIVQNGNPHGVSELGKHTALSRLQDVIDTCGESERIVMDCFTAYPSRSFQDDTFLSKPNAAQEWLHFHDQLSLKVYGAQEWELGPYLSQSVLGFHHLFASPAKNSLADQKCWDHDDEEPLPFSGPRADYLASEAQKKSKALLLGLQSSLSPHLLRSFRSLEDISTELLPNLIRILAPNIKPIVVGGSSDQRGVVSVRKEGEREMVQRAVGVMVAVCVTFERARVEMGQNGVSNYVYRMEPPLDNLAAFETSYKNTSATAPSGYAIRQALDQEYQKYLLRQHADPRQPRDRAGGDFDSEADHVVEDKHKARIREGGGEIKPVIIKRDFFGRTVDTATNSEKSQLSGAESKGTQGYLSAKKDKGRKAWVSFHEGFSNAVRKPITLDELMRVL
ncbi:P-loop containing nucleoside triphosphate hydrolase protein [Usnea florida]